MLDPISRTQGGEERGREGEAHYHNYHHPLRTPAPPPLPPSLASTTIVDETSAARTITTSSGEAASIVDCSGLQDFTSSVTTQIPRNTTVCTANCAKGLDCEILEDFTATTNISANTSTNLKAARIPTAAYIEATKISATATSTANSAALFVLDFDELGEYTTTHSTTIASTSVEATNIPSTTTATVIDCAGNLEGSTITNIPATITNIDSTTADIPTTTTSIDSPVVDIPTTTTNIDFPTADIPTNNPTLATSFPAASYILYWIRKIRSSLTELLDAPLLRSVSRFYVPL